MPAQLSATPIQAALAASFASQGGGVDAACSTASHGNGKATLPDFFARLLNQQLAGQAIAAEGQGTEPADAAGLLTALSALSANPAAEALTAGNALAGGEAVGAADKARGDPTHAGHDDGLDNLDALLPFLDAMGLTRAATVVAENPASATEAHGQALPALGAGEAADTPPEVLAVPLTPAVAAAAISAAPPSSAEGKTGPRAPLLPASAAETARIATARPDQAVVTSPDESIVANATVPAGETAPTDKELSRGREFSSQLTAALDAAREQPRTPGSIAEAAQQIHAVASPKHIHTASASLPVAQAVGSAAWTEEIGNRVTWMTGRHEDRAELVMTPPEMGRVEVSLSVKGDQATASFVSGNPAVREALEAALPRLREVLADAGIQLGQAQVSADNARQGTQHEKTGGYPAFERGAAHDNASLAAQAGELSAGRGVKMGRGLVDIFA